MCRFLRRAVHDVDIVVQSVEERGDLFRRVLQIVVERHGDGVPGRADSAEQRAVLAAIAGQVDRANPAVPRAEIDER